MPDDMAHSPDQPRVYATGDTDIVVPLVPPALWMALMRCNYIDGTSALLYQLSWGDDGDDGEPVVDGQVWFTSDQMDYLLGLYNEFSTLYGDSD